MSKPKRRVKYVSLPEREAIALELFAREGDLSDSLAIRMALLASPLLAPFLARVDNGVTTR